MSAARAQHALRSEDLARRIGQGFGPVALAKPTSNLFRNRERGAGRRLDAGAMVEVLDIETTSGRVDAEGMVTYEALVRACLARGVAPAVVPQLKTITLGGAVAGIGIEASSHRYGLVHETVTEIEVLTGDGRVIVCDAGNEFSDLFFGFPNSYGTLGYALRVTAATMPVRPYVRLEHERHAEAGEFFEAVGRHCASGDADFIDGTLFAPDRLFLTLGRFADRAPYTSDYTYERIYYHSIAERREDWLTVHDFLWRWDTDWFWCSKNLFAQNLIVRRIYGRERLGSRTYSRLMRWNARAGLTRALDRMRGVHAESVIQDALIPLDRAAGFLQFLAREIGIWPVWICPVGPRESAGRYPLFPMKRQWYVNFGFWDVLRTRAWHAPGHFNRLVEQAVRDAGGIKSLYSDSYFSADAFDRTYGGDAYRALKSKYDPGGTFPTLYDKCVRRQ